MFPLAFAFKILFWTKYRIPEMKNIYLKKTNEKYQKDFFIVMEKDLKRLGTKSYIPHLQTMGKLMGRVWLNHVRIKAHSMTA